MSEADEQELINETVQKLAKMSSELSAGTVERWMLITETVLPSERERVLSIVRSPGLRPWEVLGYLEFAKTIEVRSVTFGDEYDEHDEEDDA